MKPIEIFRTGAHAPEITKAVLRELADNYNPLVHEAPIVVGHPKSNSPAVGWVEDIFAKGDSLFAIPKQIDPAFAEEVKAGRLKKISACFYKPGASVNPNPETYSIRHVGFLGGQPPAVKGMAPVQFNDSEDDYIEFNFDDAQGGKSVAEKIGELFLSLFGKSGTDDFDEQHLADKLNELIDERIDSEHTREDMIDILSREAGISAEAVEQILDAGRYPVSKELRAFARSLWTTFPKLESALHATRPTSTQPGETSMSLSEKELQEREAALEAKEKAFADQQAQLARAGSESFAEQLAAAGKILPRQRDVVVNLLEAIDANATIEFADEATGATTTQSVSAAAREFLESLPVRVHYGERAGPDKKPPAYLEPQAGYINGKPVDQRRNALHAAAVAYQEQNGGQDKVDYVTAVKAVSH